MDWQKVEQSPTWDFEVEKELTGIYMLREESVGPNNSKLYTFKKIDGQTVAVWGNTVLDDRLKTIVFGEEVKIVYLGKQKSEQTGREYRSFEVYHRKPVFAKTTEVKA